VASARPLLASLGSAQGHGLSLPDLVALVGDGDLGARRVVHDAGHAIGRVLADLCNTLNPDAIIVGGELSAAGEPLLDGIRQAVDRHALPAAAEAVEVRPGELGERAELLGALALVIADTDRLRSAGLAAFQTAELPSLA
jgi:predicted NBD/HSP70 family sugar kinase